MDDLISRQTAIDAVLSIGHIAKLTDGDSVIRMSAVNYVLRNLPSAEPVRMKGKWLPDNTTYEKFWYFVCSECKRATQIPHYMGGFLYNFCPNCGADMRGEHD